MTCRGHVMAFCCTAWGLPILVYMMRSKGYLLAFVLDAVDVLRS